MTDIVNLEAQMIGGGASSPYLYAVPNSTMIVLQKIINATWNEGKTTKGEFVAKVAEAMGDYLADGSTPIIGADSVAAPTITAPSVSIPETASVGDVMSAFDTKYLELVQMLADKFGTFMAMFPNDSAGYASAESWLRQAVENPSYGIPPDVRQQILESTRSVVLDDAARASDAVLDSFASRRFPLPPGAASGAIVSIQQKAMSEVSATARKLAELSIDMQKFSVDKLSLLRKSAMSSAIEYVGALASGPEMASRLVGVGYDAQSKLISAASDFYRADTSAKDVVARVQQFNVQASLDASKANQSAQLDMVKNKLSVLLAEAHALSQMTTALFNNLHVSASMAANGGTSVSQTGEF